MMWKSLIMDILQAVMSLYSNWKPAITLYIMVDLFGKHNHFIVREYMTRCHQFCIQFDSEHLLES